jgi:hypothetical protein
MERLLPAYSETHVFQQPLRKTSKRSENLVLKAHCCLDVIENPITHTRTCSKSSVSNKCSRNRGGKFHLSLSKMRLSLRNWCLEENTSILVVNKGAGTGKGSEWFIKRIFFFTKALLNSVSHFSVWEMLKCELTRVLGKRKAVPNTIRTHLSQTDRLCGLVVRVPSYKSSGPRFDFRRCRIL